MERAEFALRDHAAIQRIVRFDLRLACRTGLHIGAGKSGDLVGSDLPVMRDAAGWPLIPGSSLRGVLRATIESLSRSLDLDRARPKPDDAESQEDEDRGSQLELEWREWGLAERLFGRVAQDRESLSYGSRLHISDLLCETAGGTPVAVELRDGVAISRELRTAAGSAKFDLEVVPAGTAFKGRVRLTNPADFEVGLLAQALWMLDQGLVLLGGKSARGLGWMEVTATPPVSIGARAILERSTLTTESGEFGPVEERLGTFLNSVKDLAAAAEAAAG